MNRPEVRRLLGYISAGFDNRTLSDATAEVWSEELPDVSFDVAKEAVRRHFRKRVRARTCRWTCSWMRFGC